jgi:hypothetical protein
MWWEGVHTQPGTWGYDMKRWRLHRAEQEVEHGSTRFSQSFPKLSETYQSSFARDSRGEEGVERRSNNPIPKAIRREFSTRDTSSDPSVQLAPGGTSAPAAQEGQTAVDTATPPPIGVSHLLARNGLGRRAKTKRMGTN